MANDETRTQRQKKLSVDLGGKLKTELEQLRRMIQDEGLGTGNITWGDVVRLALRRLMLAWIVHEIELGRNEEEMRDRYAETWREIEMDRTCPNWLTPGYPEPAETTKPKTKRKAKK